MADILVDIGNGLKKRFRDMGDGTHAEVVALQGPSDVALGVLGQSTERGSVYEELYYTPSAFSGDGSQATVTTSIANNLPEGEQMWGKVTGAIPAGYNTNGFVLGVMTGTWPNCKFQYASAGTGAMTTAGTLTISQQLTYPQCFASQRMAGEAVPIAPSVNMGGGWWHGVFDSLLDDGYKLRVVNGGIGSMSLLKHACGQVTLWQPNGRYRTARAPIGGGDMGCTGELIRTSTGILLECTAGGDDVYAFYRGSKPIKSGPNVSTYSLDYILTNAGGLTGVTEPAWGTAPAKGTTFVDGNITWTVVSPSIGADPDPSISGVSYAATSTPPLQEGQYGFDPFGIVGRLHDEMARVKPMGDRIVCIQNGQSDAASSQTAYRLSLVTLGNYFAKRGCKVVIGITTFTASAVAANYDKLVAARGEAFALLLPLWGAKRIFLGPNLYALHGTVPGQNNLYLESDRSHVAENVHHQGKLAMAIAPSWAASIKAALTA